MKIYRLVFVLIAFVTLSFVYCQDSEFVTLWTPKFAHADRPYNLFILPSNLNERTEIAVQFRDTPSTLQLTSGRLSTVEYPSTKRYFGNKKDLEFYMTLSRGSKCSTKELQIKPSTRNFYIFIQTDKPIYKPGDQIQFRILTVDTALKPFHMNNIDVNITDPYDRTIARFQNLEDKFKGVYYDAFNLSTSTMLGDWQIKVAVDDKYHWGVSKIFAVQKYTLPLFDAHVDLKDKHLLQQNDLAMSIYAKYSFGEYVTGNAVLVIRRAEDKREFLRESFSYITEPKLVTKNLKNLGIETRDEVKFEAYLEFTEPESGLKFNKTSIFYVHHDQRYKIVAVHPQKFLPGFPFTTKVFVFDWKNERVMTHFEKIEVVYSYTKKDGSTGGITKLGILKEGVMTDEMLVPMDFTKLSLEAKFIDSKTYRQEIPMGSINVGINSLIVDHSPKNPKLYDKVKIFIKSDTELDDVLVTVLTRYGNSQIQQIFCNGQIQCKCEIEISEQMMPHATVMVYDVRNKQHIYQGKTEIETENLGRNHLKLELSTTKATTKQEVNFKFTTKSKSKIYLLAFDKRLRSLRDGNDIKKSDVVEAVADYDGENEIIVDDMSSWHQCTPEELERLQKGRRSVGQQNSYVFRSDEPDEEGGDWEEDTSVPGPEGPATDDDLLREYFPENWLFEIIETGNKPSTEITRKAPDSITTWLISAFSVNEKHGLALVPTQELTVMEDFFLKMNLPYSIRYTEILKLDILVYNYVKTNEPLDVTVTLNNLKNGQEFQFVEYRSENNFCSPSYNNNPSATRTVRVPPMGVKKVYFYIRSNPLDSTFSDKEQKRIRLQAKATATDKNGKTVRDLMQKRLTVEPIGVKTYKVISTSYKLNGEVTLPHKQSANHTQDLTKIDVVVTGDFLSDSMKLEQNFQIQESDCLEQKTSKLKKSSDTYAYLKAKGRDPSDDFSKQQYQAILNSLEKDSYSYKDYTWYRAHLANSLGTAMMAGAITENINMIETELDFLERHQISNGTFSNFNFMFNLKAQGEILMFTERYFSTSYVLIPFLKFKGTVIKDYSHVIEKSFMYLNKEDNRAQVTREGLSIAAYAYALSGKRKDAKDLLDIVDESFIHHSTKKKCYKIEKSDLSCSIRHTAYAALAYLELGITYKAEKLIYWLMDTTFEYNILQDTYNGAIITEPISKLGIKLKAEVTNMKVTLRNEHGFTKSVEVTKENSHEPQDIEIPQYSQDVSSVVSGFGYCTVGMIFERIVNVDQIEPTLSVTTSTNVAGNDGPEKTVTVCAKYDPQGSNVDVLVNVIYEINMPSGYIFNGVRNLEELTEIKQVEERRRSTLVVLYYNDFRENMNYCVDVKAIQLFAVQNAKAAAVKVYDFANKQNVAISFYKFTSNEC